MKKPCALILLISVLIIAHSINAGGKMGTDASDNSSTPAMSDEKSTEIKGWSLYSYGLYYKNLAQDKNNFSKRNEYLVRALRYFHEAEKDGKSLDRVYAQISECYYYLGDLKQSLDYAQKSIGIDNTNINPYNRIYNIYIKQREFNKAAEIVNDYLKVRPYSIQVLYVLAEHYYRNMNDIDNAIATYSRVIEISKITPVEDYYIERAYYRLGDLYYNKNDIDSALNYYQQVLAINRNDLKTIYRLAVIYSDSYDLVNAEKYSRLYISKRPGNKRIYSILGRIKYLQNDLSAMQFLREARSTGSLYGILSWGLYYELLKNDEKSLKLLKMVQSYDPRSISLHLAMARIYSRQGDTDAAFNEYLTAGILMFRYKLYSGAHYCFVNANRLKNDVPGIFYYLGRLYEDMNKPSLAIYYYKKANELTPDVNIMLQIGYIYGVKKDYVSAVEYFNKASLMEPDNARPYFFKGLISLWKEDYGNAEANFGKAISLDDKSETYYFYFAIVMDKMEKMSQAIESLEKAIKYDPNSARAYNYLGYLYADNNINLDESLNLIKKALEIEPGNGAYTDSLGWVYFRKKNYKLALENLLNAEEILQKSDGPDPIVYDHIGDAYHELGNKKKALEYWKKSIKIKMDKRIENKIKQLQQ